MREASGKLWKRSVAWAIGSLATALLITAVFAGYLHVSGNFHVVIEGLVDRSRQPGSQDIARYVRDYGIKSIVNLLGASPADWYEEEAKSAAAFGINIFNVPLSACRPLNATELGRLLVPLRQAPKPVLIHCKSGADRAGLAPALYLVKFSGESPGVAAAQFSGSTDISHISAIPRSPWMKPSGARLRRKRRCPWAKHRFVRKRPVLTNYG